ncbi:MAG TPA: DUF1697 domain-containing protein [Candidatus Angelobacter sp.]
MRYACLLRGVNVGQRTINMRQLCEALGSAGFGDVKSYLQSGNILVESKLSTEGVGGRVQKAIADKFKFDDVDVVVLDAAALGRIMAACPEKPEAADGNKWYVTFLAKNPADELWKGLDGSEYAPDRYFAGRSVVYVYTVHYGRTKINNNFFERKLKVRATTRNWNTVTKLREMLG